MKRLFQLVAAITFVLSISTNSFGQKLSKYYSSRNQEGGNLYFIYPFKNFRNSEDGSEFLFDITERVGNDYATLDFTYFSNDPLPADTFKIIAGQLLISEKAEKIFIDFSKKKWEHRFTSKIRITDLQWLFKENSIPVFEVISGKSNLLYTVKDKKWEDYANAVDKILFIIQSESK
jgi:hypothetical protein